MRQPRFVRQIVLRVASDSVAINEALAFILWQLCRFAIRAGNRQRFRALYPQVRETALRQPSRQRLIQRRLPAAAWGVAVGAAHTQFAKHREVAHRILRALERRAGLPAPLWRVRFGFLASHQKQLQQLGSHAQQLTSLATFHLVQRSPGRELAGRTGFSHALFERIPAPNTSRRQPKRNSLWMAKGRGL